MTLFNWELVIPVALQKIMFNNPRSVMIAGGFVRDNMLGSTPKDIDVWCTGVAARNNVAQALLKDYGYVIARTSRYADTFEKYGCLPVQLMKKLSLGAQSLINGFDFTVCQAVLYWNAQWQVETTPAFKIDFPSKTLRLSIGYSPIGGWTAIFRRMIVFIERGWKVDPQTLGTVTLRSVRQFDSEKPQGLGLPYFSQSNYISGAHEAAYSKFIQTHHSYPV